MQVYTKNKPNTIEAMYDGRYSVSIDSVPYKDDVRDGYMSDSLFFRPREMNYGTIVNAFVREKYSQCEMESLINAYNASVMGISKNESKEAEYKSFLQWRVEMMITIKAAMKNFTMAQEDNVESINEEQQWQ